MNPIFLKMINSEIPTLVQFHATWCQPCKTLAPYVDFVADQIGESIQVIKVDIDNNTDIAQYYNVMSVPTILIFLKGEVIWDNVGVIAPNVLLEECRIVVNKVKNNEYNISSDHNNDYY